MIRPIHCCAVLALLVFSVRPIWGGPPPREEGERLETPTAGLPSRKRALPLYAEYAPRYAKVLTRAQREQFRQMQGEPLMFPGRPPHMQE
jgi:hypothetical protein